MKDVVAASSNCKFNLTQMNSLIYGLMVLSILFGLYTIYDHHDKYNGRDPAGICKNTRTIKTHRQHEIIMPPILTGYSEDSKVNFDEKLFEGNIDQMLQSTISRMFGDIKSGGFDILDNYHRLTDENTLFDLKSSVRSFLAKSKVIRDLYDLHKEIEKTSWHVECEGINVTDIDLIYLRIQPKIRRLKELQKEIQLIHDTQLEADNKAYAQITQKEWEKSKQLADLHFLKGQLDSDGPRKALTSQQQRFIKTFHDSQKDLLAQIERLKVQQKQTGVTLNEARSWKLQSLRRARQIVRLQIEQLPLTYKIINLKDSIRGLENVDRNSSQIYSEFRKGRQQMEQAISLNLIDRRDAEKFYRKAIYGYLDAIRQLLCIKQYTFKKQKVRHTTDELQKEDRRLENIERYITLGEQIEAKQRQLARLRTTYSELLRLKQSDVDVTKQQLRSRIRQAQDKINRLNQQISEIKSQKPQQDKRNLDEKLAQAESLRGQIDPVYQTYMRRVEQTSKKLSNCKVERIKLQAKSQDLKHRVKDATSRLNSYNENINTIVQIVDKKVPDDK